MNKPLKNSEWKSNCASSYYWITQACWSQRLTWAATPRWTYMQQLVLGRSRGRTPFSTWVSVSLWLPSLTDTCGPFCSLEHRKHDLVMSLALWHYKAGDTLQRTCRTQTNQGVRAKGRWANLLREGEAGKLLRPESSACLCLFSEIENVISCSVFLVILGGMLPQGQSVFCAKSRQSDFVRNSSGPGLENKMPIIATLPSPHVYLRKHWEHWEVNQFYQCDLSCQASRKKSEKRKYPGNHQKTGQASWRMADTNGTSYFQSCGVAPFLIPSREHTSISELLAHS